MTNEMILPVNCRVFLINEFRKNGRDVMILSMRERNLQEENEKNS